LSILIFSVMSVGEYESAHDKSIYAFIFTSSPIMYLAMSLFSFLNAKQNGTYGLEMTCKYDMYQVAAFRMLVFSVISILINLVFIGVIVTTYYQIDFLRTL